jgi:uncharacterized cupredoxin-like copper-binding protein
MRPTLILLPAATCLLAASFSARAYQSVPQAPEDRLQEIHDAHFWFGHPGKASDVTRIIQIQTVGYGFAPAVITVKVGQTVRFKVVNRSKVPHEFVIGDKAEQLAHDREMAAMPNMTMDDDPNGVSVAPGKTTTLIWTFTRPGTLQYACHIPGHYAAGMSGQLNVRG